MTCSIRPLPVHPRPSEGDNLASWMELLARENMISFSQLFFYMRKLSRLFGFKKTIIRLTSCPVHILKTLENPFKKGFYLKTKDCPMRRCNYTSPDGMWIINYHLSTVHSLGRMNMENSPTKKGKDQKILKCKSLF